MGLNYCPPLRGICGYDGIEDGVKAVFRGTERSRDRGKFRHDGGTRLRCVLFSPLWFLASLPPSFHAPGPHLGHFLLPRAPCSSSISSLLLRLTLSTSVVLHPSNPLVYHIRVIVVLCQTQASNTVEYSRPASHTDILDESTVSLRRSTYTTATS